MAEEFGRWLIVHGLSFALTGHSLTQGVIMRDKCRAEPWGLEPPMKNGPLPEPCRTPIRVLVSSGPISIFGIADGPLTTP